MKLTERKNVLLPKNLDINCKKISLLVVLLLLLVSPQNEHFKEYTTSVLGRITLTIMSMGVIYYNPLIGIVAIIVLLKLTSSNILNKNKEGFAIGGKEKGEGEKVEDAPEHMRDEWIKKHCSCRNMYDKETGKLKPIAEGGSLFKKECKRPKGPDTKEKDFYSNAELWTNVVDVRNMGTAQSRKNADDYLKKINKGNKSYLPMAGGFGGLTLFYSDEMFANNKEMKNKTYTNNPLSQIDFKLEEGNEVCNPCNLQTCNNWELKKKTKNVKKPSSVGSKTEDDSEESQVEVSADSCNIM
tara:strand:+ start:114 stop:1007 length:894 start_codon:yes stop_codon:yes gene_type:complete